MMKANELRIGNWVNYACEHVNPCRQLISRDIYTFESFPNLLAPIPLTEEWLLKLGFEKNRFSKGFNKRGFWFMYDKIGLNNVGTPINERFSFKQIEYVHQLQNLYFTLTGVELEIKS